ncbi:MAG: hybrid sensor histidine kinase/response regulator [Candidatus Kapabacteria bacterium]|nr:hybrid sensor histidine kinase/response regulator [Candidatus Kapabacteria bacterium]
MKRILIIDDADFIIESTSTLLRFEGYEVFTASEGLTGVEAAFMHKPDLILCDISMPGMDGYGVLEQIRSNPLTENTPFIFLTAFTEKADMRQGMEKGADDYIIKPYTLSELVAAINAQWNKSSRIERQLQEKIEEVGRNVTYALPHEFRTVLNQVVGSAKYLRNSSTEIQADEIVEIADDVISSASRLLRITENFLAIVRIQSFEINTDIRRQLRSSRTDEPCAMIMDIVPLIGDKYGRRDDIYIEDYVEQIYIEIATDSFHKIIDELVDNALKFSHKGSKVILKAWTENNKLFFLIQDFGRGMSNTQIGNVGAYIQFERTIYEQQGVGLGLVIAKRLVELHDGDFDIHSIEGEGTKIVFTLFCNQV